MYYELIFYSTETHEPIDSICAFTLDEARECLSHYDESDSDIWSHIALVSHEPINAYVHTDRIIETKFLSTYR